MIDKYWELVFNYYFFIFTAHLRSILYKLEKVNEMKEKKVKSSIIDSFGYSGTVII